MRLLRLRGFLRSGLALRKPVAGRGLVSGCHEVTGWSASARKVSAMQDRVIVLGLRDRVIVPGLQDRDTVPEPVGQKKVRSEPLQISLLVTRTGFKPVTS